MVDPMVTALPLAEVSDMRVLGRMERPMVLDSLTIQMGPLLRVTLKESSLSAKESLNTMAKNLRASGPVAATPCTARRQMAL